jgi:hypothetical protein
MKAITQSSDLVWEKLTPACYDNCEVLLEKLYKYGFSREKHADNKLWGANCEHSRMALTRMFMNYPLTMLE